ncbi:MAG: DUF1624 domain-containing protein [Acidobacteria bacterium]|nr:DUF1624 domain-containing protein [Acidobacteriota bacterium]
MASIVEPVTNVSATQPAFQAVRNARLTSVDILRGLVMVVMALDHVRDYLTKIPFPPEDLSHTYGALFFTRFITHYCAPTFCLLAGAGAYLAVSRGKTVQQVSHFFWTRGLFLIVLEFTVVGFGWTFYIGGAFAAVIWALGCSMVAMAALVRLPLRWIAAFGLVMIAGHNLLDGIQPQDLGKFAPLWTILHVPGFLLIKPTDIGVMIMYPLVPWIGVMACGYALGALLVRPDRKQLMFRIGLVATVLFFVLRGFNLYGNGTSGLPFTVGHWSVQPTLEHTIISFFNTQKYPPSLDYLLMTLGPTLIVLSWLENVNAERGLGKVLLVYGRVPMFYYVLHIYLAHSVAVMAAWAYHQPVAWLFHGAFATNPIPSGYGHDLPFIYLMWILVVALLYYPCRWYMGFKARHRDWGWLSYV